MAAEPDGSRFYYVPGAHGRVPELGTPVIAVDPSTGEQTTVAGLDDLVVSALDLHTSGSYSVVLDDDRRRLFVTLNAGPDSDDRWGEVVLAVVHLPPTDPAAAASPDSDAALASTGPPRPPDPVPALLWSVLRPARRRPAPAVRDAERGTGQ